MSNYIDNKVYFGCGLKEISLIINLLYSMMQYIPNI